MKENHFHSSGPCGSDLWPTDPKNSGVLLLNRGYYPMYFQGSGSSGTQVIGDLRFLLFGTLCPWPFTYWRLWVKKNACYWVECVHLWGPCDFDLSPTVPKINRVFLLKKGYHPMKCQGSRVNGYWSYWAETIFTLRVTVTLTFALLTPKSIECL